MKVGDELHVEGPNEKVSLKIVGILTTGGDNEDDAIVAPIQVAQQLVGRPAQYRQLYVSALTKPDDDFARRMPSQMSPDELERWSCSPYVSSIAYSIQQTLPETYVRVVRRIAE